MGRHREKAGGRELLQLVHDVLLVADRFRSDQRLGSGQQVTERRHVEEHVDWRKRDGRRDLNALCGDAALVDKGECEDELHIQIGDHLETVRRNVVRVVVQVAEVAHDRAQLAHLATDGDSIDGCGLFRLLRLIVQSSKHGEMAGSIVVENDQILLLLGQFAAHAVVYG